MDFYAVVDQVVALLKQRGRVTYGALKLQFELDDEHLDVLKEELIDAQRLAVDENGRILVWAGETEGRPEFGSQPEQPRPLDTPEAPPRQAESQAIEPHMPGAERRQLTVMFVDLVGSTSLSGDLDPEELRDVIQEYQAACTAVIKRYDGHVAQLLGDGLLVYFGFPSAHEEDAQRAVHAGLDILEAIGILTTNLESSKGIELSVRLGIHTGLVVVGEMGSDGHQEHLALGETPNIAARIQGLAEPDSVVISDSTHRLVQGFFEAEPLGEHSLRGVTHAIAIYRVIRGSGAQSRLDIASTRGLTPLVGRESENTLLLERWEQAKDRHGQVILLSGEAGIGKSRLVHTLKDHVSEGTQLTLECRSSPYFTNSALYPIIDMLQRIWGFQTEDAPRRKLEKLEHNLRHYRLALEESVPLFAALLSFPLSDDAYLPLNLSPQRQRQKTLEAILAMIIELAERQPVLCILEDLHWTDPTTLELLDLLIDQTPTASLYLLATCRPEFQPSWSHRSYLTEMTLNRLSPEGIKQIATGVAGGKSLPREVLQQLVEKTDGVPLYVEEMTKAVLESEGLKETADQYELVDALSSLSIPTTLQDSLRARLDRLVSAKGVAQFASVLGREFSYELLYAVSQLDEATLQRDLGRLVDAELLYQRGLPPQATYIFKHALVVDTAYESLLKSTRQHYHQRIAQVLEDRFPETTETQPELLAHHYTEADFIQQAVEYWQQAGQKGIQRSANAEAIDHLNKGLELLTQLSDTPERKQQELGLQISLGAAFVAAKGYAAPEVVHAYNRARTLCRQVEDTPQLSQCLWGLWMFFLVGGDMRTARELGEELLNLAQGQHDPTQLLVAHTALAGSELLSYGIFRKVQPHVDQCLTVYDPGYHPSLIALYGHDLKVMFLNYELWSLWYLGYPDQARAKSYDALTWSQELTHPFSFVHALAFTLYIHLLRREADMTYEQAETLIAVSREQGFVFWEALGLVHGGWALSKLGRHDEAIQQIQESSAAYRATGAGLFRPYFLALLADAYLEAARTQEGLQAVEEGLTAVEKNGEHFWEAELYRLRGELLQQLALDNCPEAEASLHQAISIAQHQHAKSWELRAVTSLARLWQSQGRRDDARELLGNVYGWFTEGFDTADLIDAKALLVELEEGR